MSPKRIALWFLIASVGASAVLGIIIVLAGTFSDLEIRIILTTLTISAASICVLACGALFESRRQRLLPGTGAALALAAALLLIAGIWTQTHSEPFWRFTASVGLLAVATAHSCLLGLAGLSRRFSWFRIAALVSIYLLAALIIHVVYFPPRQDTEIRIIGAIAIIVAAVTILTPLFHRLSRSDFDKPAVADWGKEPSLFATITCPRCGSTQRN
ncbi:MAG: hypothetical protein ACXW3C_13310, partial [Pyrinomonadaceae bacterium]